MDTNHAAHWEHEFSTGKDAEVITKLKSLPSETTIFGSVITLGEMWAGHEMTPSGDSRRRNQVENFLNICIIPTAIEVRASTRIYYGQILGRIWKAKPPAKSHIKTEKHLVEQLGIDINDVWIVASAWEHGLILLTKDKLTQIEPLVTEVTYDCWI